MDGLANDYVVAILEDRAGVLWLGTTFLNPGGAKGLTRYDGVRLRSTRWTTVCRKTE
jgi:hypothetical protein